MSLSPPMGTLGLRGDSTQSCIVSKSSAYVVDSSESSTSTVVSPSFFNTTLPFCSICCFISKFVKICVVS